MLFPDFLCAVVAIAAFRNPSSYIPLGDRLQELLTHHLFPALAPRFRDWPQLTD